ncbi:hypothetical protein O3M35_012323 [Rhynocoris fuscipes]|uniref:Uncharacterized protein n=1 Tax=Rhynocoris fuscipes TaxID=488301 RepID=A0AAW1CTE0_9HEMI
MYKMKFLLINLVSLFVLINGQDELKLIYRVVDECTSNGVDPSMCLKLKLLTAMERASRSRDLEVIDGIHLIRDNSAKDEMPLTENEIEANLPRSLDDKEKALDTMIVDKAQNFIETRSVQIKLTNLNDIPRAFGLEEGRSRRRRTLGLLLLMTFVVAATLIPLKLGALAILAGKALIISKLALALAAIVGLKKLISGNNDHQDSYQVVQVPHGIHKRSLPPTLPYRAYMPKQN